MTPVELLCTMILFLTGTFTGVVSGSLSGGEELLYSSFRTAFAKMELHPHLTIRIALEKSLLQLLFKEKNPLYDSTKY